jgi:phosphoribosylanthranilate isomerase
MTFVKLCGMTRERDVELACELQVDAVGFVMWPRSPRYVPAARVAALVRTARPDVIPVGVFVSPTRDEIGEAQDAGIRIVQIHGELPDLGRGEVETWVARSLDDGLEAIPTDVTVVLDAHDPVRHGGTGRTIDWTRAALIAADRRIVLAGGLTPGNVAAAIRQVRAYGVDVASGIETAPGVKSATAMRQFVTAVREADQ